MIHKDDATAVQYKTHPPSTKEIKLLLKAAFARADKTEYQFSSPTKKRKACIIESSIPLLGREKMFLFDILSKSKNMDPLLDIKMETNTIVIRMIKVIVISKN